MLEDDFFKKENLFLIVGASNNPEKYGAKVFKDLKTAGYNVIAINNKVARGSTIQGTPAYNSITEFLDKVEELFGPDKREETIKKSVLVLVVPPEASKEVIKEALPAGISKLWFQPGASDDETIKLCNSEEIKTIHDQCIMINRRGRL